MRVIAAIIYTLILFVGFVLYFDWRYNYRQEKKAQQCDHKEYFKVFNGMIISKNKTIDSLKFVIKQKEFRLNQSNK